MKKIFFIALLFSFTNCSKDFLDIQPREDISITEQFATLTGVKQALNGCYYKTEGLISDTYFLYPDLMGGNVSFAPIQFGSNTGIINVPLKVLGFYSFNDVANSAAFQGFYINAYEILNNANNILKYVDNLADASVAQKAQISAEAYALRGFVHFQLVQLFGQTYNFTSDGSHKGVVYADRTFVGGVDFPARKTVAQTYDLIVSDLQQALAKFTTNQALAGPSYSYFNTISTKSILAKVALQKRDWNLAKTLSNEVISGSGIALMSNSNYVSQWEKPTLPVDEVILEFSAPFDSDAIIGSSVSQYYNFTQTVSGTTYGNYVASDDLYLLFDATDVRRNCFLNPSLPVKISATAFQNRVFRFTKKFQDKPGTLALRLSEMYLIAAEAEARLGNTTEALSKLNVIRQRAGISSIVATPNLLDAILLERRKELCFEGSYFFDLARFNKNVERNLGCIASFCNLNYPNNKFVLPIPQETINVNQNMIQNEGY